MDIQMTMNFNHMAPWYATYADLRLAEKYIWQATKDGKLNAMRCMRFAFEKMVTTLAEHAGITDEVVMQVKRQMNKNGERVDLYGRILALCAYKVIDSQSANNYNTIRMLGNHAVHDCEGPYKHADLQKISKDAETMFRLLHRESILFVNKYMMTEPVVTARTVATRPTKKGGWFALGFVAVACVALYFLFIFSAMEMQQRDYDKKAQKMYEDYQENAKRNRERYEQSVQEMQAQFEENVRWIRGY